MVLTKYLRCRATQLDAEHLVGLLVGSPFHRGRAGHASPCAALVDSPHADLLGSLPRDLNQPWVRSANHVSIVGHAFTGPFTSYTPSSRSSSNRNSSHRGNSNNSTRSEYPGSTRSEYPGHTPRC